MLRERIWALFQGRSQLKLQIWPRKTPRDKELCSCVAECRACPSSEVRISSSGLRNPAGDWVKSLRGQEATRPENRLRRGAIQRGRRAKPSQTEPRTGQEPQSPNQPRESTEWERLRTPRLTRIGGEAAYQHRSRLCGSAARMSRASYASLPLPTTSILSLYCPFTA